MINWFRTLFKIVREYDTLVEDQATLNLLYAEKLEKLEDAVSIAESAAVSARASEKFIRDRTEVHADVNLHSNRPNTIIVVGRYKNRDYVEVFDAGDDFAELVDRLRQMQRHHHTKVIDGPPMFSAFIDNELGLKSHG